jgi:hypothetical protein
VELFANLIISESIGVAGVALDLLAIIKTALTNGNAAKRFGGLLNNSSVTNRF